MIYQEIVGRILLIIIVVGLAFILSLSGLGRKRAVALGLAAVSLVGGFYVLVILAFKAAEFARLELRQYGEDPYRLALPASIALSLSLLTSIISILRITRIESCESSM